MNGNEQDRERIVYACSGVANTGYLADRIGRRWMQQGTARMSCLAAIGAKDEGFLDAASNAEENIVIDGCPKACGKRIAADCGLPITHLKTTDFDVVKGETAITDWIVSSVSDRMLAQIGPEQQAT
jgi:uncharacterized metal-binding protein